MQLHRAPPQQGNFRRIPPAPATSRVHLKPYASPHPSGKLPALQSAHAIFLAGTEIRVQIEDKLLAFHFGDDFRNYQHTVPAYIPLVR